MTQVFFSNNKGVEITDDKARFGQVYYPIANIGAVRVEKKKIGYRFSGLVLLLIGLVVWASTQSHWSLLIVVCGLLMLFKSPDYEFKLVLATSSGNQQAYNSRDEKTFENIRLALESAIAAKR